MDGEGRAGRQQGCRGGDGRRAWRRLTAWGQGEQASRGQGSAGLVLWQLVRLAGVHAAFGAYAAQFPGVE